MVTFKFLKHFVPSGRNLFLNTTLHSQTFFHNGFYTHRLSPIVLTDSIWLQVLALYEVELVLDASFGFANISKSISFSVVQETLLKSVIPPIIFYIGYRLSVQ